MALGVIILLSVAIIGAALEQTYLRGDPAADTYKLIKKVMGGAGYEVPDCGHPVRHITQVHDTDLNETVFLFSIHLTHYNDRCLNSDRQRVEIKTARSKPDLGAYEGDTATLSWSFKLDPGFKPSLGFTSLHQVMPSGGDDRLPIIFIGARYKRRGNIFEIIHVDSAGTKTRLISVQLTPFLGKWVHVLEKLTYSHAGQYFLAMKDLLTGEILLDYSNNAIDMWRTNATLVRPKWGIYRSLNDSARLRDEVVRFADFCLGKGNTTCF